MKILIIIAFLLPSAAFAQEAVDNPGLGLTQLLIMIGILAVLFIILREVMLWYWKIPQLLKFTSANNELLASILKELKKANKANEPEKTEETK